MLERLTSRECGAAALAGAVSDWWWCGMDRSQGDIQAQTGADGGAFLSSPQGVPVPGIRSDKSKEQILKSNGKKIQ